ncbi:hypothetical protein [Campylobacter mucosalis]|uniref:hypothetical protein n=1 Tax=Campylobacter mucosalis TaxID=202 RepID=UPI00146FD592|nr:hypothetical protein [Campylobacter mucosalis]
MINVNELLSDPDFCQTIQRQDESFNAVVQFLSSDEMQRLPEGERYKEAIRIDTDFELFLKDIITYKGVNYRVIALQDWSEYGYKNFTAIRLNELQNPDSTGFRIT